MDVLILHDEGFTRLNYGTLVTYMTHRMGLPREVVVNNLSRTINHKMPTALSAGATTVVGDCKIEYKKGNIIGLQEKAEVCLNSDDLYGKKKGTVMINPNYELEIKSYFRKLEIG